MSHSHHFVVSDENSIITDQTHDFDDPYGSSLRPQNATTFSHFLGHFPSIQTEERAQRLSLSLGSHHMFNVPLRPLNPNILNLNPHCLEPSREDEEEEEEEEAKEQEDDERRVEFKINPEMNQQHIGHECSSFGGIMGNSRYLKAAQNLLEEVVDGGGKKANLCNENLLELLRSRTRSSFGLSSELKAQLCCSGLSPLPQKHDLQVRIAKLIGLLEEVENRYEKYYDEMEQVVSSFEDIAGIGSAKPYTGLALQAMTRHFGGLRDAIISHVNAARRKLSPDLPKISFGLSQLSLFDGNATRPGSGVSSLQRLGSIQSQQRQAWRPIRGLPDKSVAILRTWLFEHFLHPYPSDSEKLMLASQTGLTRNQVSNWFINARVRLWKPMIEEMYREEESNPSPAGGSC